MVALAFDAVTSFSVFPLRLITFTGFFVFVAAILVSIWALWIKFFSNTAVPGWTSVVLPMYFLGGVQIFCIGIIGEYLGRIYKQVKRRPLTIVEREINSTTDTASAATYRVTGS